MGSTSKTKFRPDFSYTSSPLRIWRNLSYSLHLLIGVVDVISLPIDERRLVLPRRLDLSRFRAAPDARLSHLSFEGDRAFPA